MNAVASLVLIAQLASPLDAYRGAVEAMHELPEPAYVTYRAHVDRGDASIALSRTADSFAKPRVAFGAGIYAATEWTGAYRGSDGLSRLQFGQGPSFSRLALFDPTWHGASVWLRRGLLGTLDPPSASTESAGAAPAPEPSGVIADVFAFDTGAYRVEDGGIAWCGNDPGRVLHLIPVRAPERHPLQRVTVDQSTGKICAVRFAIAAQEGRARFDGYVDVTYAPFGAYMLETESYLDVAVRQDGELQGYAHVRIHFADERVWNTVPDQ